MSEDVRKRPEAPQPTSRRGVAWPRGLRKAMQIRRFSAGAGPWDVLSTACAYSVLCRWDVGVRSGRWTHRSVRRSAQSVLLSLGRWGTFGTLGRIGASRRSAQSVSSGSRRRGPVWDCGPRSSRCWSSAHRNGGPVATSVSARGDTSSSTDARSWRRSPRASTSVGSRANAARPCPRSPRALSLPGMDARHCLRARRLRQEDDLVRPLAARPLDADNKQVRPGAWSRPFLGSRKDGGSVAGLFVCSSTTCSRARRFRSRFRCSGLSI